MAFTTTWNAAFEALPADGDNVSDGATKIRNLKNSIRERLAIDHYMDIAGTDADHGEHSKITFHAQASKPTAVANKGFLYTKDISSVVELHWEDESANEVILTRLGKFNASTGFSNGTNAIAFPTNGMAAAKIMLGDSNTIAWFYLNAAPPGWKVYGVTDYAIRVGATGGTTGGSWTISGITSDAHVHPGPSHTHAVAGNTGQQTNATSGTSYATVVDVYNHIHAISLTSGAGGTGNTDAASASSITSDGTWRPAGYIGKLYQLDTA